MINVNGVQPAGAAGGVEPVGKALDVAQAAQAQGASDVVEISLVAKLAAKLQEVPEVRADLVARAKEEIAAGNFETPQRIDAAVEKLLSDLFNG